MQSAERIEKGISGQRSEVRDQRTEGRRRRTEDRIADFGLRISKKAEDRDSPVGAAFSRDLAILTISTNQRFD
jgi:hypothetical protein